MPRTARAAVGGIVYHVHNRGNGRMGVFREPGDYCAFIQLLLDGKTKAHIELFGFCIMPNHWHVVLRPEGDRDLAGYLSWVTNTHVKRYRAHYRRTSGHLYQGRYKSFPVEDDVDFRTLVRYVEANPLKAKLVDRAQDWEWSSLGCAPALRAKLLDPWPVDRPRNWLALVNQPMSETDSRRVRNSLARSRPLGSDSWTKEMAERLGLQYTLRPRGRPKRPAHREAAN